MTEPLDFQNIRILVVGDVMLDRYWWGDVHRISPEAPVPIIRLNRSTLVAGGAANVAANVSGLGAIHPCRMYRTRCRGRIFSWFA